MAGLRISRWNNFTADEPYTIIIGAVGTGKTTLTEKLARKKNLGVKHFGTSATRATKVYRCRDPNVPPFMIADTPGYMAIREKLDHAINIIRALEFMPISRIFILTKFDARLETMVRNVMEPLRPLHQHVNAVTVIVTAWDLSDGTVETQKMIEQIMKEELNVRSIIFSGQNTPRKNLIASMSAVMLKTPVRIEIPASQIPRYFDIKKNDLPLLDYVKEKVEEYKLAVSNVVEQINAIQDKEEQADLAFYAQIALEKLLKRMKADLIRTHDLDEGNPAEYAHLYELDVELTALLKGYRGICKKFDNYTGGLENPFRKCPYCGLVWTKVEGCEGQTKCGNLPSTKTDGVAKRVWRWSYTGRGKITFSKTGLNFQALASQSSSSQPVGCGKLIEWKNMQPVPIPEELKEWVEYITAERERKVTENMRAVQELERAKNEAPAVTVEDAEEVDSKICA